MAIKKIQCTKDYRLFDRHSVDNRPLDPAKHRRLMQSMKKHGFISAFPVVVRRNGNGKLHVVDGQHRLMFAETLGLPVYWVEEDTQFEIHEINSTAKTWTVKDFAMKFAASGIADYQQGIDFQKQYGIPITTAFALLSGTTTLGNQWESFIGGTWRIKDKDWAESVAAVYAPMVLLSPKLKNARFIEACMAVCRVKEFDAKRLLRNAERCREKLVNYTSRDAYLDMMEAVYNFGHNKLLGLKAAAVMAMRDRLPKGIKARNN